MFPNPLEIVINLPNRYLASVYVNTGSEEQQDEDHSVGLSIDLSKKSRSTPLLELEDDEQGEDKIVQFTLHQGNLNASNILRHGLEVACRYNQGEDLVEAILKDSRLVLTQIEVAKILEIAMSDSDSDIIQVLIADSRFRPG